MNTAWKLSCVGAGLLLLGATTTLAQTTTVQTKDKAKVADTLVNQCANINEGDLVLISGGVDDQALLEDVAVHVRKLGAHPLITISSDRLIRNMVTEVPARFDTQEPAFGKKLSEIVDAFIYVDFEKRPDLLADVPAQRLADRAQAEAMITSTMLDRGVHQVYLGNGLYPTPATAKMFDLTEDQLAKVFWKGVNVDYGQLQTIGARVQSALASGNQVRITAPNGTDLTFEITQRPVFVSDGVISDEDAYAGGPACQVWLPAGEVFVTPVPGTANGTFIADNFFFEGKRIERLTLDIQNGKLTKMAGDGDTTGLQEQFDAAPSGRDVFAALDIGINPNVTTPPNSHLVTWMGAGTISIGIGENTWAGGENDVPYGLYAHLLGGTLTVDGKKIVDQGKLMTR